MRDGQRSHGHVTGRSFYITVSKLFKVDVHLPNHQKVDEFASVPFKIVHDKDERSSYLPGAKAKDSGSSKNAVYYRSITDRLEQMVRHEAVKEKDKEKYRKDCREDVQLPAECENH